MRILILSESFPPETKSASTLFFELAESLAKRGHGVSVVTRMPRYNIAERTASNKVPAHEVISGINVHRFRMPPLARRVPFIRGLEHFLLALVFFFGALKLKDHDVILVYSPPLPLGVAGYWLGRIKKIPVIVNIQDPLPQGVIDLGLLKNKLLIKVSRMMESFVYRRSDIITVHTEGNRDYVVGRGSKPDSTRVVYNWVDTGLVKPGPKDNLISKKFNLTGKFVVSFAGTMGFAQGLDVVLDAAKLLKDKPEISFILVGDGVERPALEQRAKKEGLSNVIFARTQPLDVYPEVLAASDACLVTLRKELTVASIPGKLLSIMAAGRPVIASVPLAGDVPKKINAFDCGICVEAGEAGDLAKAVLKLYNNKMLCSRLGENGRKAAERVFSREDAVFKYIGIMEKL